VFPVRGYRHPAHQLLADHPGGADHRVRVSHRRAHRRGRRSPFGNTTQDVPLTAVTVQLKRDLLELIGDRDRPAAPTSTNGYLW